MNNDLFNEIIKAMKSGKIFTIEFTKKDGTLRKMKARMGVTKYHVNKPPIPSTVAHLPQYLTVFDLEKMNYRNVNITKIKKFKCGDVAA